MDFNQNELAAVKNASEIVSYELSATYSASLTMENDGMVCNKVDALRRIDGTILAKDIKMVFEQCLIELDSWAIGKVDFDLLADNFNQECTPEPINDVVMDALKKATITGNSLQLTAQLDKKDYDKVNKIIVALGGKWNKKAGTHLFTVDDLEEKLADFIQTGKLDKPEKFGFFPTPTELAKRLISLADIQPGSKVLEPSAGTGNLAMQCLDFVGHADITCFEIQEQNCDVLRSKGFINVKKCDFMEEIPLAKFDRCVLNPPFEKQQDLDHVRHAFKFLKPGGTLAAIMGSGVTYRSNKKTVEFRTFLESHGAFIEKNDAGAFKESGTMVSTVTIRIVKPGVSLDIQTDDVVFTSTVSRPDCQAAKVTLIQGGFDF